MSEAKKISELNNLTANQITDTTKTVVVKSNENFAAEMGELASYIQSKIVTASPFPDISDFDVDIATGAGYPPKVFITFNNKIYRNDKPTTNNNSIDPSSPSSQYTLVNYTDYLNQNRIVDITDATGVIEILAGQYILYRQLRNTSTDVVDYHEAKVIYKALVDLTVDLDSVHQSEFLTTATNNDEIDYVSGWTIYPNPADWDDNSGYALLKGMLVYSTSGIYEVLISMSYATVLCQPITNTTYFKPLNITLVDSNATSFNTNKDPDQTTDLQTIEFASSGNFIDRLRVKDNGISFVKLRTIFGKAASYTYMSIFGGIVGRDAVGVGNMTTLAAYKRTVAWADLSGANQTTLNAAAVGEIVQTTANSGLTGMRVLDSVSVGVGRKYFECIAPDKWIRLC